MNEENKSTVPENEEVFTPESRQENPLSTEKEGEFFSLAEEISDIVNKESLSTDEQLQLFVGKVRNLIVENGKYEEEATSELENYKGDVKIEAQKTLRKIISILEEDKALLPDVYQVTEKEEFLEKKKNIEEAILKIKDKLRGLGETATAESKEPDLEQSEEINLLREEISKLRTEVEILKANSSKSVPESVENLSSNVLDGVESVDDLEERMGNCDPNEKIKNGKNEMPLLDFLILVKAVIQGERIDGAKKTLGSIGKEHKDKVESLRDVYRKNVEKSGNEVEKNDSDEVITSESESESNEEVLNNKEEQTPQTTDQEESEKGSEERESENPDIDSLKNQIKEYNKAIQDNTYIEKYGRDFSYNKDNTLKGVEERVLLLEEEIRKLEKKGRKEIVQSNIDNLKDQIKEYNESIQKNTYIEKYGKDFSYNREATLSGIEERILSLEEQIRQAEGVSDFSEKESHQTNNEKKESLVDGKNEKLTAKEIIDSADSFEDLISKIEKNNISIQGSLDFFTPEMLKEVVLKIKSGEWDLEKATSGGGFRVKIEELLKARAEGKEEKEKDNLENNEENKDKDFKGELVPINNIENNSNGDPILIENNFKPFGLLEYFPNKDESIKISENDLKVLESLMGIKVEDLENIEGFTGLSEGQQALVLNNMKQILLKNIKTEASQENNKEIAEKGMVGRFFKGLKKSIDIRKKEKEKLTKIKNEGYGNEFKDVFAELVRGMKNFGPEAVLNDGKVEIQFATLDMELTEDEKNILNKFNKISTKFSTLPDDWKHGKSAFFLGEEKREFEKIESEYNNSKNELLLLLKEKIGDEGQAMIRVNDFEKNIKINQFLSSNPEVDEALANISDKNVLKSVYDNIATERGAFFALGYAGRSLSAGLLGWVAAPAVASVLGAYRGGKRGAESLEEKDILARQGIEHNVDIKHEDIKEKRLEKNIVDSKNLITRIENTINQINEINGTDEASLARRSELLDKLKSRVNFTEDKIKDSMVSYGKEKNNVVNMYSLLGAIREANVLLLEHSGTNQEVEKRLESFLDYKKEQIGLARKKYIKGKALKGALWGAGFAGAGALARHFSEVGFFGGGANENLDSSADSSQTGPDLSTTSSKEGLSTPSNEIASQQEVDAATEHGFIPEDLSTKLELGTVDKEYNGIVKVLERQLNKNPKGLGYTDDKGEISKWAKSEANRIAANSGYFDKENDVRILTSGRGNVSYVLNKDGDNYSIDEYVRNEEGDFEFRETHAKGDGLSEASGKSDLDKHETMHKNIFSESSDFNSNAQGPALNEDAFSSPKKVSDNTSGEFSGGNKEGVDKIIEKSATPNESIKSVPSPEGTSGGTAESLNATLENASEEISPTNIENKFSFKAENAPKLTISDDVRQILEERNLIIVNGEMKVDNSTLIFDDQNGSSDSGITKEIIFSKEGDDVLIAAIDDDGTVDKIKIKPDNSVVPIQGINSNTNENIDFTNNSSQEIASNNKSIESLFNDREISGLPEKMNYNKFQEIWGNNKDEDLRDFYDKFNEITVRKDHDKIVFNFQSNDSLQEVVLKSNGDFYRELGVNHTDETLKFGNEAIKEMKDRIINSIPQEDKEGIDYSLGTDSGISGI